MAELDANEAMLLVRRSAEEARSRPAYDAEAERPDVDTDPAEEPAPEIEPAVEVDEVEVEEPAEQAERVAREAEVGRAELEAARRSAELAEAAAVEATDRVIAQALATGLTEAGVERPPSHRWTRHRAETPPAREPHS